MGWKPRRDRLPREVLSALDLTRGERVLAFGRADDGVWLVGTDRSLYLGSDTFIGIPWEHVEHATWDRDESALVVDEVADFGEPHPRHVVHLDDPRRLLQLINERVTASILLTRNVPIEGSKGLQIVARRSPVRTGDVEFSFLLAKGLDPASGAVREARRRGLELARVDLGL